MDLIQRVKDAINNINVLPIQMKVGYLSEVESLVIYPLPGSTIVRKYLDGEKEFNLNYEIAMKSKDGSKIETTLWSISDFFESLQMDESVYIESNDNSFELNNLTVTSKPFINQADEQGWFVFLLNFTANITTEEEKVNGI